MGSPGKEMYEELFDKVKFHIGCNGISQAFSGPFAIPEAVLCSWLVRER